LSLGYLEKTVKNKIMEKDDKKKIVSIAIGILILIFVFYCLKGWVQSTSTKQESLFVEIVEKTCENGHFTIHYEVENKGDKFVDTGEYQITITVNDGTEHYFGNKGIPVFGRSKKQAIMIIPDYFDCSANVSIKLYPF
jgi:hypothetical protein